LHQEQRCFGDADRQRQVAGNLAVDLDEAPRRLGVAGRRYPQSARGEDRDVGWIVP